MNAISGSEIVSVPFEGVRSGQAPLHWGQKGMWRVISSLIPNDACENCELAVPLEGVRAGLGRTVGVSECTAAIALLLRRHESLRTRIGSDGSGEPVQLLAGSGVLPVHVVEATPGNAGKTAAEHLLQMKAVPFRHAEELPVRAALMTVDGAVESALFVFSHMAVDAMSVGIIREEFTEALRVGVENVAALSAGLQPFDLAVEQHSGAGRRAGEQALRHWQNTYRTMVPTAVSPAHAGLQDVRWWRANLDSLAAGMAAHRLARELRVSTSAVLLGAFCHELAALTDTRDCGIGLMSSNRFDPRLETTVSCLMGYTVLSVGLEALDLRGTILACTGASMQAYLSALVDTSRQIGIRDRVSTERAVPVEPGYFFNDARSMTRSLAAVAGDFSDAAIHSALAQTRVTWPEKLTHEFPSVMLTVFENGHTLTLSLLADTGHLSPGAMEAFLRRLESSLVAEVAPPRPKVHDAESHDQDPSCKIIS